MAEENQKKIKEEMTELEPVKKFGFYEETEEKPAFFLKAPRNEDGETYLDMLKREKEEDREFYRMIVIQEKRRIAKNPHIDFSTGGFGPGTSTKTLYEKIQDLIKDPF